MQFLCSLCAQRARIVMKSASKSKSGGSQIARNRRAGFDYELLERFEAGVALLGWEVKSLRHSGADLSDSYVRVLKGETWLIGAHITPLPTVAAHEMPDPTRSRKLLLHAEEIAKLYIHTSRRGATCIALSLHWRRGHVKCDVALARGKKRHDKREATKQRDWNRQKQRLMRAHS